MKIQKHSFPLAGFAFAGLLLSLLMLSAGLAAAQTSLKSVKSPEGGKITYGVVDGVTSQAGGLASVLKAVHSSCGERPQISRVFRFRGTDTVGVFFTVVNHPAGNAKVAGLALAAMNSSQRVEAALVSDNATRFGKTVNPMLKELFGEWHPAATATAASSSTAKGSAAPASAAPAPKSSGPVPILHPVSASDNSATIGIPEGWTFDQHSAGGMMLVTGPHGEQVGLNMTKTGIDPTNPQQMQLRRSRMPVMQGTIVYPFRGDMAKSFPDLFQAWRHANGKPPAKLQVDEIKPMQAVEGNHCVMANGHMDPDGKGMQIFSDYMCAFDPAKYNGMYLVTLSHSIFPEEKERETVKAIVSSWKVNQQVIAQQTAAATQKMNENTQALIRQNQMQVDRIHQIGAQATARMQATEAANDAQHASYWAQQDSNARNGQGFSNYLLDQTVVQDNNMYNNGTVGHGTVWNGTADALVKSDPNRFEIVDTPGYWKGIDY
jgi:Ni/Co efflux regulator RcnB